MTDVEVLAEKLHCGVLNFACIPKNRRGDNDLFIDVLAIAAYLIDKGAWWVPEEVVRGNYSDEFAWIMSDDYDKMIANRKEVFNGFLERS